ncbi:MAG: hypothetical protein WC328_07780 [Kiritimatiellia bacterium]|nr:hypothetical protein [Kiritimatiellia bacterium]
MTRQCAIHHTPMVRTVGFVAGENVDADPSWDYVRFMAEAKGKYPNTTPWDFSHRAAPGRKRKAVVETCPVCDSEFQRAFSSFQKLPDSVKDGRCDEALMKEVKESTRAPMDKER